LSLAAKFAQLGKYAASVKSPDYPVLVLEGVVTTGEAFWAKDHPFSVERRGYTEETYFDPRGAKM
jgi:hypothetical protein